MPVVASTSDGLLSTATSCCCCWSDPELCFLCPRLSSPKPRWGDLERDWVDREGFKEEEVEEERDDKEEEVSWSSFDAQFLIRSLSRLGEGEKEEEEEEEKEEEEEEEEE